MRAAEQQALILKDQIEAAKKKALKIKSE